MAVLVNKYASGLSHERWDKLSPEERSAAVPHNGGRPCIYPPCTVRQYHRWKNDKCRFCGLEREVRATIPRRKSKPPSHPYAHTSGADQEMSAEQAKATFRWLVANYGLQWGENVPTSAHELLERTCRALTLDERQELLAELKTKPLP